MKVVDLVLCEANCNEHQIIIKYDDDIDWENVYISYHLQNFGFWKRLKYAVKYLFGYKSQYGNWGELVLSADDETIDKFQRVVDKLKTVQKSNLKKTNEILGNKVS